MTPRVRSDADFLHGYTVNDSSNVELVAWDAEGNLYVQYRSGGKYKYQGVSRQRAVAVALAPSVGQYVNKKIKPNYDCVKIG
jgi:hypothetical protein